MAFRDFETQVSGKWVLAGEHAVLRGLPAVALPHSSSALGLQFIPLPSKKLSILPQKLEPVILALIEDFRSFAEVRDAEFPAGELRISSTIPIGAGLGSSAALCWALTGWLGAAYGVAQADRLCLATRLEDRFHGKSSGMDVAAVAANEPIWFVRGQPVVSMGNIELPRFTFQDTGIRFETVEAIARVEKVGAMDPRRARELDEQMGQAAETARTGFALLQRRERLDGLHALARAMNLAQECFRKWGLVPGAVAEKEREIRAQGALSVKLTGAGGGGFLVALWPDRAL